MGVVGVVTLSRLYPRARDRRWPPCWPSSPSHACYLRVHYAADVLAGLAFGAVSRPSTRLFVPVPK